MSRDHQFFLGAIILMTCLAVVARGEDPDTFSPAVSYQFQEALAESDTTFSTPVVSYQYQDSVSVADAESPVGSPVVSYQYFDWPGDENVTFQSSSNVSYFFSGGVSLAISGTIKTVEGTPIEGATVTLKRYGVSFWSGVSDVTGNFVTPDIHAASFTIAATKPGYVTHMATHDGTTGGTQFLQITMRPIGVALRLADALRSPTEREIHVLPVPEEKQPRLLVFNGADAFTLDAPIYSDRSTVVFSHGWQPKLPGMTPDNATDWCLAMAQLIKNHHGLAEPPNMLVWDWRHVAFTVKPRSDDASVQGDALGAALLQTFGASYSKHLHFIGHSLGTIVNGYACNYVHGTFDRSRNNPAVHWNSSQTSPHLTLLDEAKLATVFETRVLTAAALGWAAAGPERALAEGRLEAQKDWKSPIPRQAWWLDNYISLVGLEHLEAVNVALLWPSSAFLLSAHSYAYEWYGRTILPSGQHAAVGFGRAFEAGGEFPPSGSGLAPSDFWLQDLRTTSSLDLLARPLPKRGYTLNTILSNFAAGVKESVREGVTQTASAVGEPFKMTVEFWRDTGATIVHKGGQVTTSVVEKAGFFWDASLDYVADIGNSLNPDSIINGALYESVPRLNLITGMPPAQNRELRGALGVAASTPAYAWINVDVPQMAGMMAFDFTVTGDPVDDRIVCAIGGENIFNLPARFAPDGSPVSTDMLDISAYAGQTVEVFFGLVGGTSTGCAVTVDGLRFILIPEPTLRARLVGPNVELAWPAAAVGWTPEASDTLASDNWQPVPMTGVTRVEGVATLQLPDSTRKFFRLRRTP